jgi:hypothetical protein
MVGELGNLQVDEICPVHLEDNERESFTVLAAIRAARTTLSLSLIAAGKTDAVEQSHFGKVGYHRADHSESGWTTADTFRRWLTWLHQIYDDWEPLWLILDCWAVHHQEKVKCYATELGVNLLFIRPWSTDELQPLDRFVFGLMNTNSRRLYGAYVTELSAMSKQIATACWCEHGKQLVPKCSVTAGQSMRISLNPNTETRRVKAISAL